MDNVKVSRNRKKYSLLNVIKSVALLTIGIYICTVCMFEGSNIGMEKYASIGLYLCLVACAAYTFLSGKISTTWFIAIIVIFGMILTFSTTYTKMSWAYISPLISRYWKTVIALFFINNVINEYKDAMFVLKMYVLAGMSTAIYIYTQSDLNTLISSSERLEGTFGNQNAIGLYCAFAVAIAVFFFFESKGLKKLMWMVPMVVCMPIIAFVASRKAIILVGMSAILLIMIYKKSYKNISRIIIAAASLFLIYFAIRRLEMFELVFSRFDNVLQYLSSEASTSLDSSDKLRQRLIEQGLDYFAQRPLFGNGYYSSAFFFGVYSHNNYVELLMNNGIVGILVYYFIYAKIIKDACLIKNENHELFALILSLMLPILFIEMFLIQYDSRYNLLLLLCFTVAITTSKYKK